MAFSTISVTHAFENADSTPASGSITFSLTKRMTNAGTTIVPSEITANLNGSGQLTQTLTSNQDAGTVPQDAQWRVDFRLLGDQAETFYITVPVGPGTVDLGTLLPQQPLGG